MWRRLSKYGHTTCFWGFSARHSASYLVSKGGAVAPRRASQETTNEYIG